ncbi:MAG TPA: LLM class flavin-dependent oxidoreductase [Actinocrinis sp.]|uniref:LLM class flavin-dependent oxidoreductase n=1 Tax=Actinocrinis sp. TaxID=1920516 RepID=UPI002DDCE263|nr:LLM class flavin-dependent oxidoreductase [Actinocrinis sp.]HEV2343278.1 LLM class flavin-dependent oxidoreductase [Actinocrinis sp.]
MAHDTPPLHLAVALDGAGRHPASWRDPSAAAGELFTPGYWTALVAEAQSGTLDFVTFEDRLTLQSTRPDGPDGRADQVRGTLAALPLAARTAPATSHVGLVPAVTVTHTEPFHTSRAVATLDFVAGGRAGWCAQVARRPEEAGHFDPRLRPAGEPTGPAEAWAEAADYVEVVRRLWDSWEDDAEIRDPATGRYLDADRLHRVGFRGRWFSVEGPSVTPRPPQGQPPVCALADTEEALRFAAASADVVFVTPHSPQEARDLVARVREEQRAVDRAGETVHVFADLAVALDAEPGQAARRLAALDALDASPPDDGAALFAGTPAQLADRLALWADAGLTGFRLRPVVLPYDLRQITRSLVQLLRARGAFRADYEASTLRGLLGLARPANRYARTDWRSS